MDKGIVVTEILIAQILIKYQTFKYNLLQPFNT